MYSLYDHYDEIESRRLRVKLTDGTIYEGDFYGVYSELETTSGEKELELDTGEPGIIRAMSESEIEDIEALSERHGEWK